MGNVMRFPPSDGRPAVVITRSVFFTEQDFTTFQDSRCVIDAMGNDGNHIQGC